MAGGWGSKKNGIRIGVFWDGIELNSDGSQARITNARIRIDRDVNIVDSSNSLSWSGGAVNDGSASNINCDGSGAKTIKNVTGQWQDLNYGSTKSANFASSMTGVNYAGGTLTASESVTYPARTYSAPLAPTDLAWVQNSPGNFTLSWTNRHSTAAPWTTVVLLRTEVGGATTTINVSNPTTAQSIAQNGLALDKRYSWQLRITNPTSTVTSAATSQTPIPLHTMTLSPSSSRAIGESVTFTINKYGSPNTSTIYFIKNGVKTVVWDKQAGTSFTYTFTQADWAGFLPTETSKVFVVGIETFSGSTSLGVNTQNITVTVPNTSPYLPTATAPTRAEQVAAVATAFGVNVFVRNKSRIRYTWSGTAGASATITKREILIYRAWQGTTTTHDVTNASGYRYEEVPTGNGSVTVTSRTTDSRGRVATAAASFTVYNYADPVVTTFTVARCDAAGNLNNSGTYVKFTINVSASSVNPGSEQNRMQYRVRLLNSAGAETGSDLYSKALDTNLNPSAVTTGPIGGGAYSAQAGYSFRLTLNDDLTNATAVPIIRSASISSEVYPLTIGTNGIAIGKVYNDSNYALDVVGRVRFLNGGIIPVAIGNAENLNNYVTAGVYHQHANVQAASGSNYPQPLAGLLEVDTEYNGTFIYQRYTIYSADVTYASNVFVRGRYNGNWSAWARIRDSSIPLVAADIPALDASKTTSGVFADARIPNLNASKITAGNLAFARLPLALYHYTDIMGTTLNADQILTIPNSSLPFDGPNIVGLVPYNNGAGSVAVVLSGFSGSSIFVRNVGSNNIAWHASNSRLEFLYRML